MFNITRLIEGMTATDWFITAIVILVWMTLTHIAGKFSEKRWGDRESGALVGFFVPGLILVTTLYFY
ncbi:hypothetical protein CI610_00606 [invertebrate metagenome]|uniref:Uncharacterized protein n=1 Tax=invertebrate metagenome TaxID=1711999 RepID=A0A2H9TB50_9ZZZZ